MWQRILQLSTFVIILGSNSLAFAAMNHCLHETENTLPFANQEIYGNHLDKGGFSTAVDAVKAASDRFNPTSIREDVEFIGAILSRGGEFFYSAQQGLKGQDEVQLRLRFSKAYRLVAFWHTHGAESFERTYFSDLDTRVVAETRLPFYLADHSGQLKVYEPDAPLLSLAQARRKGLPSIKGIAEGRAVRDQFGKLVMICTT